MEQICHLPTYNNTKSNQTSVEALDSSIFRLVKNWQRRQKWLQILSLLDCCWSSTHQQQQPHNHYHDHQNQYATDNILAPRRIRPADLLDSLPAHLTATVLLLIDLALTVVDLSTSLLSCNSNTTNNVKTKRETIMHEVCHWGGIVILGLLMMRSFALALGLGWEFFRRPGYIIDAMVVAGALVLETAAEGKGAGLLVMVSLWRVLRVVETAFELSNAAIEGQIEALMVQCEEVKCVNRRLRGELEERDEIIQRLLQELAWKNGENV